MRASYVFLITLLVIGSTSCQQPTLMQTASPASSKPSTLSIGSKVILKTKYGKTVSVSDSSESWMDEHIIARLPNDTPAEVILSTKFQLVNGQELIRYKVAATHQGKEYVGWVSKSDVQSTE